MPDALDDCPHLAGPQLDSDGDGVGDACDPEPAIPRQHRALFATLQPGDQPFALTGDWMQQLDALRFPGDGFGGIAAPFTATALQVTLGFDVDAIVGTGVQHQLALSPNSGVANAPSYFTELNEVGGVQRASISFYDGTGYTSLASQDLPNGVHTGRVAMTITMMDGAIGFDGGWDGETYHLTAPVADVGPLGQLDANVNNAVVELRYAFAVITDPGP